MTYRKVGGIRFLRLGRYQFMFCRCRSKLRPEPRALAHDAR
jgi:hypothetical protein